MTKHTIKNRRGLKLVIQVDEPENPKDLVFITHGQGGFKEQVHVQAFAEVFLENNFRVVRFDATNSIGESEGDMMNVTYTNYIEDLEDVISWARGQEWFQSPFALCGQSMGAQSTAWYAEEHPDEVKLLAPIAPVVNYELYEKTLDPKEKKEWQSKGYVEMSSRSKPGVIKKVGWGVNENLKQYDLLPNAGKLSMPVLFMVGEFDEPCPYENQKVLFDKISSTNKKFVRFPGLEHSFRNNETREYDEGLDKVKKTLGDWLKTLDT
jgi:pimeloyl-ACP methyl ester carboxylesterase